MSKLLLTEYYELCPNGKCDDLLTEEEKNNLKAFLLTLSDEDFIQNPNFQP